MLYKRNQCMYMYMYNPRNIRMYNVHVHVCTCIYAHCVPIHNNVVIAL